MKDGKFETGRNLSGVAAERLVSGEQLFRIGHVAGLG